MTETQSTKNVNFEKISKEELRILDDKEKKIISDLENKDITERGYKKQKILELKEIYLLKLQYGLLPIKEKKNIASYIWNNILDGRITINESYFYTLFTDEEKINRTGTNFSTMESQLNHKWNGVVNVAGIGDIQDCQDCDAKKINGIVFNPEPEKTENVKEEWSSSDNQPIEVPDIMLHPITKLLQDFRAVLSVLDDNTQEMQDKYLLSLSDKGNVDELAQRAEIKKIFDEYFTDSKLKELKTFVDEQRTNQNHNKNLLDWRLRIGRYEKLIAKTMMLGDQFIHEVAKKLHCSAKHMKNDVLKEDIERDLKKFRECPKCHYDIAEIINKQLVRADLQEDGIINS